MANAVAVRQWRRGLSRESVTGMSENDDPLARAEKIESDLVRVTLDLRPDQAEFLEKYAAYRNVLNLAEKRQFRKWTRKSAAEAFVDAQIANVRKNMKGVFDTLGELPDSSDEKALSAYVERVLQLDAPTVKPTKKR